MKVRMTVYTHTVYIRGKYYLLNINHVSGLGPQTIQKNVKSQFYKTF